MWLEILCAILIMLLTSLVGGGAFFLYKVREALKPKEYAPKRQTLQDLLQEKNTVHVPTPLAKESKSLLLSSNETIRFSDVGGMDAAKDIFQQVIDHVNDAKNQTERLKCCTGILLSGPPGVGKTLLVKAFAAQLQANFYYTSGNELVSRNHFGTESSAQNIKTLFATAKKNAPSVIFCDEIDLLGSRNSDGFSALLTLLDRIEKSQRPGTFSIQAEDKVIFVAATNDVSKLDSALLRHGRFDHVVEIGLPNLEERAEILQLHARGIQNLDNKIDWGALAQISLGTSGADLAHIIHESVRRTHRNKDETVTQQCIEETVMKCLHGNALALPLEDRRRVAFHEAGHAVLYKYLERKCNQRGTKLMFPLVKVTIASREAFLGANLMFADDTSSLPILGGKQKKSGGRGIYTIPQLEDWMTILWGGALGEINQFGCYSTGATDDIKKIKSIAKTCIKDLLVNCNHDTDTGGSGDSKDSQVLTKEDEMDLLIARTRTRCQDILATQQRQLDALAAYLIEYESISNDKINQILS